MSVVPVSGITAYLINKPRDIWYRGGRAIQPKLFLINIVALPETSCYNIALRFPFNVINDETPSSGKATENRFSSYYETMIVCSAICWMVTCSNIALVHDSRSIRLWELGLLFVQVSMLCPSSASFGTYNTMPQRSVVPQDDVLFFVSMSIDVLRAQRGTHNPVQVLAGLSLGESRNWRLTCS